MGSYSGIAPVYKFHSGSHPSFIAYGPRFMRDKNPNEYVAIGPDDKGRLLEVVAKRNVEGDWLIYHAQTPPQKSARRELGLS